MNVLKVYIYNNLSQLTVKYSGGTLIGFFFLIVVNGFPMFPFHYVYPFVKYTRENRPCKARPRLVTQHLSIFQLLLLFLLAYLFIF
jgi:hypothetical protein